MAEDPGPATLATETKTVFRTGAKRFLLEDTDLMKANAEGEVVGRAGVLRRPQQTLLVRYPPADIPDEDEGTSVCEANVV